MELSVPVDNEVKLNVRHRPGGGGRPFVLVHGLGSNARLWDETAERLAAAGHPVYAVDMRGHGDSEEPEHGYDNATAVADLVAICRELDLTGVLLGGHSWGGNLSVRLSVEHPGLVSGLALVDGGWVNLTDTTNWEISWEACAEYVMQRRPDNTGATAETMRDFLRALHPSWSEAAIEASLGDMREGPDGLLVPQPSAAHYLEIVRSMWDDPPGHWHARVQVPVLLLNAIPPASPWWEEWVRNWAAKAEAAMPHADSRWYLGTDHNVHAEQPERLAADLLDLARTVGAPRPTGSSL